MKIVPMEFQKEGVRAIERFNGRAILADEMGLGKRLAYGTPVLTTTGWVPIEDIQILDRVYGSDGQGCAVTGVYHHPDRPLYQVTFNDNVSIDCDDEHIWTVQHVRNDTSKGIWRQKTTQELVECGIVDKSGNRNWRIPLCQPIDSPSVKLPDNPYLVGVVLGDGCYISTNLWKVCTDKEILDSIDATDRTQHKSNGIEYGCVRVKSVSPERSKSKKIPDGYLTASKKQRRDLLAGLLDTDGWINPSGTVQFCSVSPNLTNGIVSLVQSLGGTATIHVKLNPKYTYKGEKRKGQTAYIVTIRLNENPFQLKRKAKQWKPFSKYKPTRTIKSIKRIKNGPGACISIDSPDHLYVTKHYVLTHNTLQALHFLRRQQAYPALVVVPASVDYQWQAEAKNIINEKSVVLESRTPYRFKRKKITIINHSILSFWAPKLLKMHWETVILDECHKFSSLKAKRTEAAQLLTKNVQHIIPMSGTLLSNRPKELWPILNIVRPDIWPNFWTFAQDHCEPKRGQYGWDFNGASNLKQLHRQLRDTCMIRRLKKDVLKDMPKKTRKIRPVQITDKSEYEEADTDFIKWLSKTHGPAAIKKIKKSVPLAKVGYLLRLAAKMKARSSVKWINRWLRENPDKKLAVFAYHAKMVNLLERRCKAKSVVVDGSVTGKERTKAVQIFQTDKKTRLFIGNITAAGTGIDGIQRVCNHMVFVELWWVPGDLWQAEDRIHRIGQNKKTWIWYLVADGTIEEKLCEIIQNKQIVISDTLDGGVVPENFNIHDELKKMAGV